MNRTRNGRRRRLAAHQILLAIAFRARPVTAYAAGRCRTKARSAARSLPRARSAPSRSAPAVNRLRCERARSSGSGHGLRPGATVRSLAGSAIRRLTEVVRRSRPARLTSDSSIPITCTNVSGRMHAVTLTRQAPRPSSGVRSMPPGVLQEPLPGQPFDEFGERPSRRAVELAARSAHHVDHDTAVGRSPELPIQALHGLSDGLVVTDPDGRVRFLPDHECSSPLRRWTEGVTVVGRGQPR